MWNSRRDPVFLRTWQVAVHVLLAPSVTPRGRLPFWVFSCLFLLTETLWVPHLRPVYRPSQLLRKADTAFTSGNVFWVWYFF